MDSYIVTAFWLHLLCLYLVGTVGKKRYEKRKKKRMIVSALVCALADAAAVMIMGENGPYGVFLMIAAAEFLIGSVIAFGKERLLLNAILLFAITAFLSGIFQLLPVKNVGLCCLLGTVLLPVITGVITVVFQRKQIQKELYKVKIYWKETNHNLSAFMDTGNRLHLYGSRSPVILVDETYLTEWIEEAKLVMPQKLVFLPYKGVGGRGLLHGVRLYCEVFTEHGQCIRGEVAAVAAEHRLFSGCEYRVILQPEVLSMVCVNDAQEGEKYVI